MYYAIVTKGEHDDDCGRGGPGRTLRFRPHGDRNGRRDHALTDAGARVLFPRTLNRSLRALAAAIAVDFADGSCRDDRLRNSVADFAFDAKHEGWSTNRVLSELQRCFAVTLVDRDISAARTTRRYDQCATWALEAYFHLAPLAQRQA
jgi:hypothetical protein